MLKLLLILTLQQLAQSAVKMITPTLQPREPPPYCSKDVCYKSLPSDQDWWFLSHQGVTFDSQQTARDVERCHIHCLEKFFKVENTTVPSKGEVDLYSFNSSEPKICAKQCVGRVLGLSAVELCQNYSICDPNNSSIIDGAITDTLGEPTKPTLHHPPINSTELSRYGLVLYSLDDNTFGGSIHGVVWTVKNAKAKSYVSQQILYAFLHEKIDDLEWVGSFNTPTFQCSYVSLAYQLVNSTSATKFSKLTLANDVCLTGQHFPEPPSPSNVGIRTTLVEISNGTRTNPTLRVKIYMLNSTDQPFIDAKGLRIRGHDKVKVTTIFREVYCDLLDSETVLTYERPSETRFIVLQESQVRWDVLWSCYHRVDLQYYSLPKPPPESGIQPRVLTIPFNIEDQGSPNSFYPLRTILFDTNTSRHISYVVRGNDTERCTIDVEVTFRVTISNVSVLFLSQISVNMTNVTGLRQIVLREYTNPATNNTDIIISPQKEGLVVIIRQRANGVKIIEEKIIKSELLFGSNYFNYVYTVNFNDSVPSNSEPEAVQNITLLDYTVNVTQDQVVARFSWASSSTACYLRLKYIVTLSSPLSLNHHREEYSPPNDKGKIYYNLNTTWYRDDYYNITIVAVYGHQKKTAAATMQFTMTYTPAKQQPVKMITPTLQPQEPLPYCSPEVCCKSLPSDQDWWFLSHQGVTFDSQQMARDVERCHIHCLEKFFKDENITVPSKGEVDLYSFNSSEPKICAKQCVGHVLGLSAVELCQNYSICDPNNSSIIDGAITDTLGKPTKPTLHYPPINSTELSRYGLLLYSLDDNMFGDSIHGVVWTVKNTKAKSYVSQQILYAFLHEKIDELEWVGSFNTPTFQCSYVSLAYQLVNSTSATKFSKLTLANDVCLTGQHFPEPPSPSNVGIRTTLVEISNGTRTNPTLRVKIYMLNSTDQPFIDAKGLRIRGHDKVKVTTIFREVYCDLLDNETVLTYERPSETRFIVLQESQVHWDVLWSCYHRVDLQYYSLPKPPPESGIQPRVLTIPFNIEDQGSRNSFYPLRTILFDTNTSRHISYVVRGNDTERCTIDVEVTFRVTISNVSVLFLSQISVNMTNVTGLHQIVLREYTNPATNNTDIIISPQKEGLVVIIRQRANGVKIIEEKIIKSELLFGSNSFDYVYIVNFNDSVPSNSEPEAVQNITLLDYTVDATQDQVVARFSWASSSTACYPQLKYIVTLSSPLSLRHHREEYSPPNDKGKIYYNLNTTWYRDDYYNITIVAVYGHRKKTAAATMQFTMMYTPANKQPVTSFMTATPNSIVAIATSISVVCGLLLCMCPCICVLVCVLWWCFRRNKQEAIKHTPLTSLELGSLEC